jgi:transcription antitermination protein NusB
MTAPTGHVRDPAHRAERDARRLALGAVFEADFGQTTAGRVLERRLSEEGASPETAVHARRIVEAVVRSRDTIDAQIEAAAPAYPVTQLARIDRALLRSALGELLHCPTTPARVAISEWVELARTYSGDPARRLLNGVLGRVARGSIVAEPPRRPTGGTERGIEGGAEPPDSGGSTK